MDVTPSIFTLFYPYIHSLSHTHALTHTLAHTYTHTDTTHVPLAHS